MLTCPLSGVCGRLFVAAPRTGDSAGPLRSPRQWVGGGAAVESPNSRDETRRRTSYLGASTPHRSGAQRAARHRTGSTPLQAEVHESARALGAPPQSSRSMCSAEGPASWSIIATECALRHTASCVNRGRGGGLIVTGGAARRCLPPLPPCETKSSEPGRSLFP